MRGCCCCFSHRYLEVSPKNGEDRENKRSLSSIKLLPSHLTVGFPCHSVLNTDSGGNCARIRVAEFGQSFWTRHSLATVVICQIKVNGEKGMQNEGKMATQDI